MPSNYLSYLLFSAISPFRHFTAFVAMAALPMMFSLFYFQTGGDWTVGILPDSWQNYKYIEEDVVRYLSQAAFLCLWYPLMVRHITGKPVSIVGPATLIFFMAYGFIFLLTKAIYWLATLMQISLFFIARGFNEGLPEDVTFLMIVGIIMTLVGIITATIINRCSFGLPECATGTYATIKDGWLESTPHTTQLLVCTAILFGLDMSVSQTAAYFIDVSNLGEWASEIILHIRRYLLLAMTAALICKLALPRVRYGEIIPD